MHTGLVRRKLFESGRKLMEERRVRCYTFAEILDMVHASACRILLIDAEGADCEILQSMGEFCIARPQPQRWPWIILFESRGYANTPLTPNKEEETVGQLQRWGYILGATPSFCTIER